MIPVDEEKTKEEPIKDEQKEEQNVQEELADNGECANNESKPANALAEEYLNLAKVIQADFDNFRKRSIIQIQNARLDGIASTAEVLLPSLDAFKKVKETVKDEKTLEGIDMLEKSILTAFEKLGIKKIDAVGLPLDPNVHNALAVAKDESKQSIVSLKFEDLEWDLFKDSLSLFIWLLLPLFFILTTYKIKAL